MSTVNAIGKLEKPIKLAIVPGGTANLVARALDIPFEPEDAVSVAIEGGERNIDLAQCGSLLFALGLGMGLTEKLVSKASAKEKERLGKWAYVLALLKEELERNHPLSLIRWMTALKEKIGEWQSLLPMLEK